MEHFYTKDGIIELKNGLIKFERISKDSSSNNRLKIFVLLCIYIVYQIKEEVSGRSHNYVLIGIGIYLVAPYFFSVLSKLFIESWKIKYSPSDIKEIILMQKESILEQKVIVRLKHLDPNLILSGYKKISLKYF